MIKRFLSVIMTFIISMAVFTSVVSADLTKNITEQIAPQMSYTMSCQCYLDISGTTISCTSLATGYPNITTKINIVQTLQKKNSSGGWDKVASWASSDLDWRGSCENTRYNCSKGTYRLYSVFTVFSGSDSERIPCYSTEEKL